MAEGWVPSAIYAGWADPQLGALYAVIERKLEQFKAGSTEHGCLSDALKQIELADVHVEKRQKEAAEWSWLHDDWLSAFAPAYAPIKALHDATLVALERAKGEAWAKGQDRDLQCLR